MSFSLTAKQQQALTLLGGRQTHTLLYGGSRAAKTFLAIDVMIARACAAPGSRHACLRFRYNAAVQALALDTIPKVLKDRKSTRLNSSH